LKKNQIPEVAGRIVACPATIHAATVGHNARNILQTTNFTNREKNIIGNIDFYSSLNEC